MKEQTKDKENIIVSNAYANDDADDDPPPSCFVTSAPISSPPLTQPSVTLSPAAAPQFDGQDFLNLELLKKNLRCIRSLFYYFLFLELLRTDAVVV